MNPPGTFELCSEDFDAIRRLVYAAVGITLGDSKRALVVARLSKRLREHGYGTFREYVTHLRERDAGGAELKELINCVTTNKTEFFREPHHFDWLRQVLVPQLKRRAQTSGVRRVRLWSAGCSTGQEPYSIAMVLADELGGAGWDVRVLASDIDTNVLAEAEAGIYDADAVGEIPEPLRRRYLEPSGGRLVMARSLRDLISFRRVNFVEPSWPIRTKFDVIFCRNVTIYFDRPTQAALYERFAAQLEADGYLVAGHSENLHWLGRLFALSGPTVYCRAGSATQSRPSRSPRRATSRAPAKLPSRAPARASLQAPARAPSRAPPVREVSIQSGGICASAEPTLVKTVLGSCVAACLYDPVAKVGGMNHFMLPEGSDWMPNRFGKQAMEALMADLVKRGADRRRLRAKIFGGSHVLRSVTGAVTIPDHNVEFVRRFLADAAIPIESEKVGGKLPLLIRFETHTGRAFVRTVEGVEVEDIARREVRYGHKLQEVARKSARPPAAGGDRVA